MGLFSKEFLQSLDKTLYYSTNKVVLVRDYRLGGMYWLCFVAITGYIIYNMISSGSYLDKSPPIAGSIRFTAELPSTPLTTPSYCTPGTWNTGGCVFWSANDIVYPYTGEPNTIFITTRVSISTTPTPASLGCDQFLTATNSPCRAPSPRGLPTTSYYVANVEDLTLSVDHSVRSQSTLQFGSSSMMTFSTEQMRGSLLTGCTGDSNKFSKSFDDAYRQSALATYGTTLDIITFNELMTSAYCESGYQFSMNIVSTASGAKPSEPLRSAGFVLSMPIYYLNRQGSADLNDLKYRYVPAIVNRTEVKIIQSVTNANGSITYYGRHGIRIIAAQTGSIGQFNPLALILNLVAGLALLSLATLIVDYFMILFSKRTSSKIRKEGVSRCQV
ncbi:hypothetical protein EDD86DRAFT_206863 [Gorgonomyces haynaldii]|nr:hypothetical protein EDD86DRAFT_206863 [Gorgonomyces haynaldii]